MNSYGGVGKVVPISYETITLLLIVKPDKRIVCDIGKKTVKREQNAVPFEK